MSREDNIKSITMAVINTVSDLENGVYTNDEVLKAMVLATALIASELDVVKESFMEGVAMAYDSMLSRVEDVDDVEDVAA